MPKLNALPLKLQGEAAATCDEYFDGLGLSGLRVWGLAGSSAP